jgi:hypothetical protein
MPCIYETLPEHGTRYDDVVEMLSNYFKRNKNISYERYLFRKTKQGEIEITDNFIVRLSKFYNLFHNAQLGRIGSKVQFHERI